MPNEPTKDEVLKHVSLLLAETVEALVPLIEATEPHPSPLGSMIHHPTPREVAASLSASANALRAIYPK
jgi:hypothetical protein